MQRREALKAAAVLVGTTLSLPTLAAMDRRYLQATNFLNEPFLLTEKHTRIIAEVAEIVIPRTDTPGAKDAGVPDFISMMLKDCYREPEHLSFLEGLYDLDKQNFLDQSESEKIVILTEIELRSKEKLKAYQIQQTKIGDNEDQELTKSQIKGLPFWRLMKELTLLGYFTSEAGLKSSFAYVPIPGKLELITLEPGQKAFAY